MKSITRLFITLLTLSLSVSLGFADSSNRCCKDEDEFDVDGIGEAILGLIYDDKGIEFQVASSGCTEKADFVMQKISPDGSTASQLLLIRVEQDPCDGLFPYGEKIFYTYEELDLKEDDTFSILNPLSDYRVILLD
jgi:hypothetical protein